MPNRSLGWIQDASDFSSLKKALLVFMPDSELSKYLVKTKINKYILDRFGKQKCIDSLINAENGIDYNILKGVGASNQLTVDERMAMFGEEINKATAIVEKGGRPNAACSGILQIAIDGQKRPYQTDWSVEAFLKWAIALGFLLYDSDNDKCFITPLGKEYAIAIESSKEENEILGKAMLKYPPVLRVLKILDETHGDSLTKFEIGAKLGFIGEDGFTSYSQRIWVDDYVNSTPEAQKKMKSDCEGTSDKYARMIAVWLKKLGWIKSNTKKVKGINESDEIELNSYFITISGTKALRKGLSNSNSIIVHNGMLATKAKDANYLKKRRAIILKCLTKKCTVDKLQEELAKEGLEENIRVIKNDLNGLNSIGIVINNVGNQYILNNKIDCLIVPKEKIEKEDVTIIKSRVLSNIKHLDHKYLCMIDYAFDGTENKNFELETASLLTEELKFKGKHLGGSRKPDNVAYYDDYFIIIDNKAYSGGYNLPVGQRDEMARYIDEFQRRDAEVNPNRWWEEFGPLSNYNSINYMFISSIFVGEFGKGLSQLGAVTHINGCAISIEQLLYLADELLVDDNLYLRLPKMFKNIEYIQLKI